VSVPAFKEDIAFSFRSTFSFT